MEQKGIAKIKVITRQLEDALARQDDALQRRDFARYAAAAATAEDARSALASVPALTLAEILAKAKSLGPVPTTALASLSQGEFGSCRQHHPRRSQDGASGRRRRRIKSSTVD